MSQSDLPESCETHFSQIHHEYIGYQSLTDVPKAHTYREEKITCAEYQYRAIPDIVEALRHMDSLYCQCQLWGILLNREGAQYDVNGTTVFDALTKLYHRAGTLRYWRAVRYCSSLMHHTVDSISPFITTVLVNGKQLTVGVIGQKETVFDKPMTPAEIQNVMYTTVQPFDVIQAVLQQEVVLYCGRLIATNPDIFKGVLKIRIGWVLEAIRLYLSMSGQGSDLDNLSPYSVRILLQRVLTVSEWASDEKLTVLQRRQLEGCLCRVPDQFYNLVWDVLGRTPKGIAVQVSEREDEEEYRLLIVLCFSPPGPPFARGAHADQHVTQRTVILAARRGDVQSHYATGTPSAVCRAAVHRGNHSVA